MKTKIIFVIAIGVIIGVLASGWFISHKNAQLELSRLRWQELQNRTKLSFSAYKSDDKEIALWALQNDLDFISKFQWDTLVDPYNLKNGKEIKTLFILARIANIYGSSGNSQEANIYYERCLTLSNDLKSHTPFKFTTNIDDLKIFIEKIDKAETY